MFVYFRALLVCYRDEQRMKNLWRWASWDLQITLVGAICHKTVTYIIYYHMYVSTSSDQCRLKQADHMVCYIACKKNTSRSQLVFLIAEKTICTFGWCMEVLFAEYDLLRVVEKHLNKMVVQNKKLGKWIEKSKRKHISRK